MMKLALLSIVSSLCLFANLSYAASFDCTQARAPVEKMICSNDELSNLDQQLHHQYYAYLTLNKDSIDVVQQIKREQRAWLKARNQQCITPFECAVLYAKRIATLQKKTVQQGLIAELPHISDSNQLIWNREFRLLRADFFGDHSSYLLSKTPLLTSEAFAALMSGPPQAYQDNGEVVIAMSCRQHSCPEKGIVAIDKITTNKSTTNKKKIAMVFAAIHYTDEMGNSQIDKPTLTFYYRDPALFERVKAEILAVVAEHVTVVQVNEVLIGDKLISEE
ncbi:lysozyme inhibitor LprI family protein [Vibrio scophthalmi]|uniref:lysozyme inhibitor LprI family protein n=1 Tax=Vibrio scophthalmi TaxID=45658 RepID=UPI0038730C7B